MTEHITVKITEREPRIRNASDSLEVYATPAFGFEVMSARIEFSRLEPGQIDAERWWERVPAHYRPLVLPIVERAFQPWHREVCKPETLRGFIVDLHVAIWRELPVMSQ